MSSRFALPRAGRVWGSAVLRRGDSPLVSSSKGRCLAWQVLAWLCAAEDRAGGSAHPHGSQEPSGELVGLGRSIACLLMGPQSSVAVWDSDGALGVSRARPGLIGWGSGLECWSGSAALLSTLLPCRWSPGCFLSALWLRDLLAAVLCCQNAKGK